MYTSRCYLCEVYDIFKERGKFTPRYIGLFKITKKRKEELKAEFPKKNPICLNLEGEIHFKWGRFVTPQNSKFWNVTKIH
jgi:hypothetical protein